jgi:mannose-6-phosphate isomerase-like protein (cupin superfamily)
MVRGMTSPAGSRRATPRPAYDAPTVVRRDETAHHVWGDAGSGLVTDRVYVSTGTLHVLEYELAPGGEFRHSPGNKTVFAADVAYCVLEGTLVIADPEHGEVRVVEAGEQVLFRRDTWHHGFNPGAGPTRVLEFFAPPPSRGTASTYAVTQPMLEDVRYRDDRWAGRWPEAQAERDAAAKLHVTGASSALWGFAGDSPAHLVGTVVDTEHLTVGIGRVAAGHVEDPRKREDESVLVVTEGELWVDARDEVTGDYTVACLRPGDAAFLPRGTHLRVLVRGAAPAAYLLGAGRPVADGWTP